MRGAAGFSRLHTAHFSLIARVRLGRRAARAREMIARHVIWRCCPSRPDRRRALKRAAGDHNPRDKGTGARPTNNRPGHLKAATCCSVSGAVKADGRQERAGYEKNISVYNLVTHADQTSLITITNINMSSLGVLLAVLSLSLQGPLRAPRRRLSFLYQLSFPSNFYCASLITPVCLSSGSPFGVVSIAFFHVLCTAFGRLFIESLSQQSIVAPALVRGTHAALSSRGPPKRPCNRDRNPMPRV